MPAEGEAVPGAITGRLDRYVWSNEETAAYEAAVEAVNGAVGACSALLAAERARPEPDRAVMAEALAARARLAREREGLRPGDRARIAAARVQYGRLTREVPGAAGVSGPEEAERYRLPERENLRVFREEIVPDLLAGRPAHGRQTVVFLVAQPGAGKAALAELVGRRLRRRGWFADIGSDLYKPYHSAHAELSAGGGTRMTACTRADGRSWMARAERYVRENGMNALVQETSQDAPAVVARMRAWRAAGATVEALFLAVPRAMGNQGIVARYFAQLADRGQGRLTVRSNADRSYDGIGALAGLVDRSRPAGFVAVYRRGESRPRYGNGTDADGAWQAPPGAAAALDAERSRPWTDAESRGFATTQLGLRATGRGLGGGWAGELARIEDQAAPYLTPGAARRLQL
jgi:hypothetical protein